MAAVLICGEDAVLSHESAAALWEIRAPKAGSAPERQPPNPIHVSVPGSATRIRGGIKVHRRSKIPAGDQTLREGIPVTSPALTLIDLGLRLDKPRLEAAVNEADRLGLIDPQSLRVALETHRGRDGVAALRELLDRRTFAMTDSELERRFMRIVVRAGLPLPLTQELVNGFSVDFYWPELGLVVETDGLRYHRTPAAQARDRVRDQAHTAAGLTPLRFTHAQVSFEAAAVAETLRDTAMQCRLRLVGSPGRKPGNSTQTS